MDFGIMNQSEIYEVCKECNGKGYINMTVIFNDNEIIEMQCFVCNGSKKFDWIEITKGKNKKLKPGFYQQDISLYKKTKDGKWTWDYPWLYDENIK